MGGHHENSVHSRTITDRRRRHWCHGDPRTPRASQSKAFLISESEVLDKTLVEAWNSQIRKATESAGGSIVFSDKVVAVVGAAPQRAVVTEFESVAKADAYLNSSERKALVPQRDKAIKIVKQYIIEGK